MRSNEIYNADCTQGMRDIPDETIDLIVTDPPYLMNYFAKYRNDKTHPFCKPIANDKNNELSKKKKNIALAIEQCYRILKPNSAMYMFCNASNVDFFKQELEKYFKIKNIIVWVKNHHTAGDLQAQFGKKYEMIFYVNKGRRKINGKRLPDVWEFKRVAGAKLMHQNQKPLELIQQCIEKSSEEGDIVLDPFIGSGTTALACLNTNRRYIGYEIDEYYYKIARNRIKEKEGEL